MKKRALRRFVQSEKWFWTCVGATALALVVFAVNAIVSDVDPANAWGVSYGTAAAVLMLVVAAWGIRRRTMRIRSTGKAQTWVQMHVYGGWLFLLLTLMHDGFRAPRGSLTAWLLFAAVWVSVSGILGVVLQKWVPRMLTSGTSIEVLYERVPELVEAVRVKAEELVAGAPDAIQDFYARNVARALLAPQSRWMYYIDVTGGLASRMKQFEYLRRVLQPVDQQTLDQLEKYYRTKLELDAHYTLQKSLRWWLYTHVPASLLLIVLAGIHIVSVIVY
jgi:hypothetical protein